MSASGLATAETPATENISNQRAFDYVAAVCAANGLFIGSMYLREGYGPCAESKCPTGERTGGARVLRPASRLASMPRVCRVLRAEGSRHCSPPPSSAHSSAKPMLLLRQRSLLVTASANSCFRAAIFVSAA